MVRILMVKSVKEPVKPSALDKHLPKYFLFFNDTNMVGIPTVKSVRKNLRPECQHVRII